MVRIVLVTLLMTAVYGCHGGSSKSQAPPQPPQEVTIGSLCELEGYQAIQLRGYSLVWGLDGTGSSECPPSARQYLLQYIRQTKPQAYLPDDYRNLSAEQLIDSPDTAVVEVSGMVPAGAPKNTIFDVDVYIPWASQTTSLQGGRLMPTELQMVTMNIAGKTTAMAAGAVFINPFTQSGPGGTSGTDPRRGVILGGGVSLNDRQINLALLEPDSRIAQQVQKRINSRFQNASEPAVADAVNRGIVSITTPQRFRDRYQHFIAVLLAIYLQNDAAFQELKLNELNQRAGAPDADFEAISLEWEAIGRNVLRWLEPMYADHAGKKAFYAARTALNLGDNRLIDVMVDMALDDAHPCQALAIEALGNCPADAKAARAMITLLEHPNNQLRLLAYVGLRKAADPHIISRPILGKFRLETVKTGGNRLIYLWAQSDQRIVIFGDKLVCENNVFFESDDKTITINSGPKDTYFTIAKLLSDGHNFVQARTSDLSVEDLIITLATPSSKKTGAGNQPTGVGLTFSQIVGVIHQLCRQGVIPAGFEVHRVSAEH
jgi:flagellar basal body P-ring protein FlgI